MMANLSATISQAPDVVAELAGSPDGIERYRKAFAGLADGYYRSRPAPVVFDKGRLWANHAVLMRDVLPDSVIVVTVRDPRDIVASMERQHRKTGIFRSHNGIPDLHSFASQVMSPQGSVGLFIAGIQDLVQRQLPRVVFVRFENLLAHPQGVIDSIYAALGEAPYTHDYSNVENVAPDVDAVYRYKFPHDGSGAISPARAGSWKGTIPPGIAGQIAGAWPMFMQAFGYQ
jgi:sulfotransferase